VQYKGTGLWRLDPLGLNPSPWVAPFIIIGRMVLLKDSRYSSRLWTAVKSMCGIVADEFSEGVDGEGNDSDVPEPWDKYENPGTHDPSGGGPNGYKKDKSVLPSDHESLWKNSQATADGNRWTKLGKGKKSVYHRFQNDGNGNWHWNGSSAGRTKRGVPRAIKLNDIPNEVRRW